MLQFNSIFAVDNPNTINCVVFYNCKMNILGCLALVTLISAIGETQSISPNVASRYPYYPGYNPLGPVYNSYYNPTSTPVPILSYTSNHGVDGSYDFSYQTGDGKQAQEKGFLKSSYIDVNGEPQGIHVKEGSFSYISPEGTPIQQSYVADERGFRPSGVHIQANGKGFYPAFNNIKGSQTYDPRYNLYDPYKQRNQVFKQYDSLKPYDSRYFSDPRNNPYRTFEYNN